MLFGIENLDEMCHHFGFNSFPRAIGNPRQTFVFATEQVYSSFQDWNGIHPCFISTAGYDNLVYEVGGKQVPRAVIHTLTFFDFDHETKPENAFADAQRLSAFLTEMDIAHWVQYSGSKGYHLFIVHTPTRFKFDYRDGSSEALKQILQQTQDHLRQSLGLNTLDEQTTGDPKRLCRFPFTKHVNRMGEGSGRHAIPIPTSELSSLSHEEIVRRAYWPQYVLPEIYGRKVSLKRFIDKLGVALNRPEDMIRPIVNADFDFDKSDAETSRYLASLNHRCMGVVNELKRMNPPHKARVYSALFAKTLGMSMEEFEAVWVEMGTKMGYVDLHNHDYRRYQMSTLFDDPRWHTFPNCTTLKANGCCVGEICPRFKDMEADDYQPKRVIRKWSKPSDKRNENHEILSSD